MEKRKQVNKRKGRICRTSQNNQEEMKTKKQEEKRRTNAADTGDRKGGQKRNQ